MLCRNFVQIEKLRFGAAPGALIGAVVRVQIGFVPYFPVLHVKFESVRPAVIVVKNYMLADFRPFYEICRRQRVVFFNLMLYALPETEKSLSAGFQRS